VEQKRDDELSELAQAAFKGDVAAFNAIVKRFQRPVYTLCLRYVGPTEAEDVAQETFIRAFVHRDKFNTDRPLLPWLLIIARRLCIDSLRRIRSLDSTLHQLAAVDQAPRSNTEQHAVVRQELSRVQKGLAELKEGHREALILFYVEELSYQEIAEILDAPLGTIMSWLHRGRAKLGQWLSADETEETPGGEPT
jgi:RNA polymerase sigma-70 factor (ECF subfamily)